MIAAALDANLKDVIVLAITSATTLLLAYMKMRDPKEDVETDPVQHGRHSAEEEPEPPEEEGPQRA